MTKKKSLNENSQIRDLPLLPLSKSNDTHKPEGFGIKEKKTIDSGKWMYEACDLRMLSATRPLPKHWRGLLAIR
jgi:hypothetical protein